MDKPITTTHFMKIKSGTEKRVREAIARAGAIHMHWLTLDWNRRIARKLDGFWKTNTTKSQAADDYRALRDAGQDCVSFQEKWSDA